MPFAKATDKEKAVIEKLNLENNSAMKVENVEALDKSILFGSGNNAIDIEVKDTQVDSELFHFSGEELQHGL